MVMTKKLIALFLTNTGINQYQTIPIFDKQAAHRPCAKVAFIGWIGFVPNQFGYNAKHGSSVQLKKSCVYYMQFHTRIV
jgi:hypothetical protein